jgi:hypothetical protein
VTSPCRSSYHLYLYKSPSSVPAEPKDVTSPCRSSYHLYLYKSPGSVPAEPKRVTRFNFEFGCEIVHPLPLKFVPWRALLFPTCSFMKLLSAEPVPLIHSRRYIVVSRFPVVKQCLSKLLYVLCTTFHLEYDFSLLSY